MASAQNEDITKQLSFGRQHLDGSNERKTIYPLAEADLAKYHLLGVGSAQSPSLAIFMGFKHCPGFYERVVAYRLARGRQAQILENASGDSYGSIEFFEERNPDAGQDEA
jgi:hypothetical protein